MSNLKESSQSYAQNFLIFWMNHLELMSTPSSSICWTTSTSPLYIERSSKVKLNFEGNLSQAPQSPLMIFGACSSFLLSSTFLLGGSDILSSPLLTIFCAWKEYLQIPHKQGQQITYSLPTLHPRSLSCSSAFTLPQPPPPSDDDDHDESREKVTNAN